MNTSKKKYIAISFFGGIGDQIFQYSFANYLKKKFKCDVYLDLSYYKSNLNYNKFKFRLYDISKNNFLIKGDFLKIKFEYLSYLRFINLFKINIYFKNIISFFFSKKINNFIYEYIRERRKIDIKTYSFYYGYWHNFKYVKLVKNQIYDQIFKKIFEKKKINSFINKINLKKMVCVHIRGGDFKWVKSHNTLDSVYYKNSINFFKKKIKDPVFHIYTNDVGFAKNLIRKELKSNKIIFTNKYNFSDIEEFSLFSFYKYSIIANSTFSLTSSYISKNNKITIAPKVWMSGRKLSKKKIFKRMVFL
jgi:hypothetical protein